jgi:tRNA(Leu) C34 or U34 (ribose-2'-O)-methylase TrmL
MKEKRKTMPNLSLDSEEHQAAIIAGNGSFSSWQYNVIDKFKSMDSSEIKSELNRTALPFAVCMENWIGDFNMATAIRNANVFNAKEVFYIGNKKWDRRGAVGVQNYTEIKWISHIDDLIKLREKYVFVGIDNVPGSVSIHSHSFVPNTLMFFGEEGAGLTPAIQSLCDKILHIDMFGSVRSLNCGTASGIAMYEFASQYVKTSM